MTEPTPSAELILLREWRRPGRPLWLGYELLTGERVIAFENPAHAHPDHPAAVLFRAGAGEPEATGGGGLRLAEGLLWSLLDPLDAGAPVDADPADRVAVETSLRGAAARFRRRLAWWRGLPAELRAACRGLVAGFRPDIRPLFDLLDTGAAGPVPPTAPVAAAAPAPVDVAPPSADPDGIYRWLNDPAGFGALYGPEFSPRAEQAEMGRLVAGAVAQDHPLLVEAGTGVGKTLAYLVPLVAAVVARGTRACVSTHTRALQSQILDQDLPRLRPLLGERKFALLMGRRNYLCLRQRQAYLSQPLEDLGAALRAVAFRLWLHETADGMRDEIAGHPLLAVDSGPLFDAADLCLPGLCYEGNKCFVQNARRRARDADVLVVNHSLLLQDHRAGHTLLGEIDHLVVDEAHRLPEVTLDAWAVAVGMWRLGDVEDLLGRVRGSGPMPERVGLVAARLRSMGKDGDGAAGLCEDFSGAVRRVFTAFSAWWQDLGSLADSLLSGSGRPQGRIRVRDKDEVFGPLRETAAVLLDHLSEASDLYGRLAGRVSTLDDLTGGLEDDLAQIAQAGQLLRKLQADVHFLTTDPDEDWVTWLEPGRQRGVARLGATLLEAGDVLRECWQDTSRSPVMTSATLAVGEDFTHMLGELGLTRRRPPTVTATCPSPFDYHEQSLVLTPRHFPDPSSPGFGRAVGEVLAALGHEVGRKTLGLFTSYRLIREAADVLAEQGLDGEGEGDAPVVLVQTPRAGTGALLSRFRRHRRATLLGTTTFWEGVDFPGEDLEILVVTKLPFLVPNDPWVEARCDRIAAAGENPFTRFMVRDAVLRLRQGFGRLIRRSSDRGVVIILDNRLHTKNYGTTFLSALPVMPATFGDSADLLARVNGFFHRS